MEGDWIDDWHRMKDGGMIGQRVIGGGWIDVGWKTNQLMEWMEIRRDDVQPVVRNHGKQQTMSDFTGQSCVRVACGDRDG